MRLFAIFTVMALATAPLSVAYADGVERQAPPPRQYVPAPAPAIAAPTAVPESGPETVTLSESFIAGSSGGVGADVAVGAFSNTTIAIRGSSAHASVFAFASARASARGFGHGGGCGCH